MIGEAKVKARGGGEMVKLYRDVCEFISLLCCVSLITSTGFDHSPAVLCKIYRHNPPSVDGGQASSRMFAPVSVDVFLSGGPGAPRSLSHVQHPGGTFDSYRRRGVSCQPAST